MTFSPKKAALVRTQKRKFEKASGKKGEEKKDNANETLELTSEPALEDDLTDDLERDEPKPKKNKKAKKPQPSPQPETGVETTPEAIPSATPEQDTPKSRKEKKEQAKKAKHQQQTESAAVIYAPTYFDMNARLFVASVGNPAPYYNTLHSAGHHMIDHLKALSCPHTLYKSTSQMNISGVNIKKAYKNFLSTLPPGERADARLVVVHDEMELPLGKIRLREQGSLRGHNGLKSVKESFGGEAFAMLGVGIGRPASRESGAVSDYVLRKMTSGEKGAIVGKAELAMQLLENLKPK